jgi:hypothetical protein
LVRLYANENSPLPAVQELRRLGNDALTIQETGGVGQALIGRACESPRGYQATSIADATTEYPQFQLQ